MVTFMSVLTHLHNRLNEKLPQVPARLTRFTPAPVMELFLNTGINHLLKKERQQNDLDFLKGQVARVEITDLNFNFSFTLVNQKLVRSEEHTSELQSRPHLVCRLLPEKQ